MIHFSSDVNSTRDLRKSAGVSLKQLLYMREHASVVESKTVEFISCLFGAI